MKYPDKEKRDAEQAKKDTERAAAEEKHRRQAKTYAESESFEEYVLKCSAEGIDRKWAAFGLVDPFRLHYWRSNGRPKTWTRSTLTFAAGFLATAAFAFSKLMPAVWCAVCGAVAGMAISVVGMAVSAAVDFYVSRVYWKCERLMLEQKWKELGI